MTDLSFAAQAVLDAFDNQPFKKADGDLNVEGALAAALRASANVVAPEAMPHRRKIRAELLAIAAELEQL